jgi:hypothetical protein
MIETTLVSNGSTAVFEHFSRYRGTFWAFGTFGGGTVVLEASRNNGTTWIPLPSTSFTANNFVNFQINSPCSLRVTLSGATAPSLFVAVDSVRGA